MGEPVLPAGSNPKVDPETLVLRAKPRRATRFRRGVLIGAAAMTTGTMALLGVVALRPHDEHAAIELRHGAGGERLFEGNALFQISFQALDLALQVAAAHGASELA